MLPKGPTTAHRVTFLSINVTVRWRSDVSFGHPPECPAFIRDVSWGSHKASATETGAWRVPGFGDRGWDHGRVTIPSDVRLYLERLVERLSATLGDRLLGVYALGSVAFDDYRPKSSDVDVYGVVDGALDEQLKLSVAECCSHRSLPCPARRLELVVISAAAARRPGSAPGWELNLNTGAGEDNHLGLDPTNEPTHWLVLDLAIAHERGVCLVGPPARELIGAPDAADVRAARSDVVAWYAGNETGAEMVTAACRAWHWLETGTFAARSEALRWATVRLGS